MNMFSVPPVVSAVVPKPVAVVTDAAQRVVGPVSLTVAILVGVILLFLVFFLVRKVFVKIVGVVVSVGVAVATHAGMSQWMTHLISTVPHL